MASISITLTPSCQTSLITVFSKYYFLKLGGSIEVGSSDFQIRKGSEKSMEIESKEISSCPDLWNAKEIDSQFQIKNWKLEFLIGKNICHTNFWPAVFPFTFWSVEFNKISRFSSKLANRICSKNRHLLRWRDLVEPWENLRRPASESFRKFSQNSKFVSQKKLARKNVLPKLSTRSKILTRESWAEFASERLKIFARISDCYLTSIEDFC